MKNQLRFVFPPRHYNNYIMKLSQNLKIVGLFPLLIQVNEVELPTVNGTNEDPNPDINSRFVTPDINSLLTRISIRSVSQIIIIATKLPLKLEGPHYPS